MHYTNWILVRASGSCENVNEEQGVEDIPKEFFLRWRGFSDVSKDVTVSKETNFSPDLTFVNASHDLSGVKFL